MEKEERKVYIRWGITAFIVLAAAILVYFLCQNFEMFQASISGIMSSITPVLWGLAIGYILSPVTSWIKHKLTWLLNKTRLGAKPKKSLANVGSITLSLLMFVIIIVIVINMIVPQLLTSIVTLIGNMDIYINTISEWLMPRLDAMPQIKQAVLSALNELSTFLDNWFNTEMPSQFTAILASLASQLYSIGGYVINFLVGLIAAAYVLARRDILTHHVKRGIYAFLNKPHADVVIDIVHESDRLFKSYITGQLIGAGVIGVCCFVGMSAFQMPYVMLISALVGITNVIPYFGPFIGAIPSALLILLVNPSKCVGFIIFILVLQQIEGNIITPKILGQVTGISSLGVLFSILLGGYLFGIVGMLVSVPMMGVVCYISKRIVDGRLKRKNLSV